MSNNQACHQKTLSEPYWGNARLVRAASPLLTLGEASAKGEACGVRELDFPVSPQDIGGIKGGKTHVG
ncbi:hypothetical protein [Nostoc sp.]|uniref:hypothetical protein n=1 Tax=Nostoc sp. TaxID=1180 RepID=UPI002FF588B7